MQWPLRERGNLLDRLSEELAEHTDGVKSQRQDAGQHPNAEGLYEHDGEDQIGHCTTQRDDAAGTPSQRRVRRRIARREKRKEGRKR